MNLSIIMPTYNQSSRLYLTLLSLQESINSIDFINVEVIIIDDGSTDKTEKVIMDFSSTLPIKYFKNPQNLGRAYSRNIGIKHSSSDLLLFLDSDRIVSKNLIANHYKFHSKHKNSVGIGQIKDIYISNLNTIEELVLKQISKLSLHSRNYPYWSKIQSFLDNNNEFKFINSWLACLVGNMSINKKLLIKVGGFDTKFNNWGFEHFELGYRLVNLEKTKFFKVENAESYHIAHKREKNFYENHIIESQNYFYKKHQNPKILLLKDLLLGSISIKDFESK